MGKQKELAELFIELKRQGWIHTILPITIQNCFTESNTIGQILKPSFDTKNRREAGYDQVYTLKYYKMFENIRLNKKNKH